MAWRTEIRASGPVVEKLRALCLSFPETSETSSWGHPNFRAGKRTFAAFERVKGRPSIAFSSRAAGGRPPASSQGLFCHAIWSRPMGQSLGRCRSRLEARRPASSTKLRPCCAETNAARFRCVLRRQIARQPPRDPPGGGSEAPRCEAFVVRNRARTTETLRGKRSSRTRSATMCTVHGHDPTPGPGPRLAVETRTRRSSGLGGFSRSG